MRKIVFSKLWKHDTYCKVGSAHFQDKRFRKVYMNQEWGNREISLWRLKGIINFSPPRKRLILLNQLSKQGYYWKIVGNEMLIKVGKSKKTLDILNRSWSSLINNGLNLTRIHANAISKDNITQKFHFRLMEFTLFQFGIKSNLLKLLQN
jgi:hypothetical protein